MIVRGEDIVMIRVKLFVERKVKNLKFYLFCIIIIMIVDIS